MLRNLFQKSPPGDNVAIFSLCDIGYYWHDGCYYMAAIRQLSSSKSNVYYDSKQEVPTGINVNVAYEFKRTPVLRRLFLV